ncbi:MAG: glycosyltransferase family 2 protein [Parasporobacterium sp.]|nr:glycosyltransferase family 2 protein [Parasporobacterium sp.]
MNHEKPEISFIIPVYNGEKVISRVIESVYRMPEKIRFEVIVIDDGSTDKTPEIVKKEMELRSGLRMIRTSNSGQSRARNLGVEAAGGDYIFFADADDRILAEGVDKLLLKAKENRLDVVSGTYLRIEKGKKPYQACSGLENGSISRKESDLKRFHAFKTESAFGYIWNKLFRKDFLLEHDIWFDDTIRVYMEDQLFNLKTIGESAKYYFLNVPVYEYFFEGLSTTRKPDAKIAEKSVDMLKSYVSWLEKKNILEQNMDLLIPLAMRMACWAAFKNIRYEGASYSKIKARLILFSREKALRLLFETPDAKQHLKELSSFFQRRFFSLTFRLLKQKREGQLAFLFVIGSPLLTIAAGSMVR